MGVKLVLFPTAIAAQWDFQMTVFLHYPCLDSPPPHPTMGLSTMKGGLETLIFLQGNSKNMRGSLFGGYNAIEAYYLPVLLKSCLVTGGCLSWGTVTGKIMLMQAGWGRARLSHPHVCHPDFAAVLPKTSQWSRFGKDHRAGKTQKVLGSTTRFPKSIQAETNNLHLSDHLGGSQVATLILPGFHLFLL